MFFKDYSSILVLPLVGFVIDGCSLALFWINLISMYKWNVVLNISRIQEKDMILYSFKKKHASLI